MNTSNPLTDQLKQMDADRKKLLERLQAIKDKTRYEYKELQQTIKAHDIEVGRLLGFNSAPPAVLDAGEKQAENP